MEMKDYQELAHETAMYPSLTKLVVSKIKSDNVIPEGLAEREGDQILSLLGGDNENNPYYPALGLAGEVGEYCNKLKKVMRDKNGEITEEFKEFAAGELGDILWYIAECASSLDLDLGKIAEDNIDKLQSRKERGKIQGEGDNR